MKYKINEPVNVFFCGELCDAVVRDIHVKNNPPYMPEITYTLDVMAVNRDKNEFKKVEKELVEGVVVDEIFIMPHPLKKEYGQVMTAIKKLAHPEPVDKSKPRCKTGYLIEKIRKDISAARKYGFMDDAELSKIETELAAAIAVSAGVKEHSVKKSRKAAAKAVLVEKKVEVKAEAKESEQVAA